MAATLWTKRVERLKFAATHPRLVARRLRGQSVIEISVEEIRRLVPDVRVIVEAGACDGANTQQMAEAWPDATIHAFEPVPDAFQVTRERVGGYPNVRLYEAALSDSDGAARMFVSTDGAGGYRPDSSSLLMPTEHKSLMPEVLFDPHTVKVQTVTLDSWAEENAVPAVDLMWLDMQGVELRVLQASPRVLSSVRAVAMEVSRRELYEGTPLYPEVVAWMKAQGFRVALDRMSYLFGNVLFKR